MNRAARFSVWANVPDSDWNDWRWQLKNSITSLDNLAVVLGLSPQCVEAVRPVVDVYCLCVTPYYLSLVGSITDCDPIALQCVPDCRELNSSGQVHDDPFDECRHMPVPGLIRRYSDRVLVLATDKCAVHCRHCTRKNTMRRVRKTRSRSNFKAMFDYIVGEPAIREVIISGGDPLLLDTQELDWLLGSLAAIEHVEVLRIGTRVPAVLPMRINSRLCETLASHRPLWVNTQFNHPLELTREAISSCEMLIRTGIPVSNQAVLLRGVNDSLETIKELCCALQRNMIRPYYVFQCDPVRGTEHFHMPPAVGAEMEAQLSTIVGGLALPRFVADIPGSRSKTPLCLLAE